MSCGAQSSDVVQSEVGDRSEVGVNRYLSASTPDDAVHAVFENMSNLNTWRLSGNAASPGQTTSAINIQYSASPEVLYNSIGVAPGVTEFLLQDGELLMHTPEMNILMADKHPGLTEDTWLRVPNDEMDGLSRGLLAASGPAAQFGVFADSVSDVVKIGSESTNGQSLTRFHAAVDQSKYFEAMRRIDALTDALGITDDVGDSAPAALISMMPTAIDILVTDTGYLFQSELTASVSAGGGTQTAKYSNLDLPLEVPVPAKIMDKDW